MPATFSTLLGLDAALVRKGHHALTPWWKAQLARYYQHSTARTLVARVGRGGAKSHTSVKTSINEVLYGDWKVPPGEVHFWAYVSISKEEATQRLMLIERFLSDLGIPYARDGEQITLRDKPRGWRVFAAQIGAVSGFRCFGYSADELAKWRSSEKRHVNPAAEVIASLNAMAVTHRGPRKLLISSPFGLTDYHARRFNNGDTADQIVASAPTWVANEANTREMCEEAEPDVRTFRREYACEATAAVAATWDRAAVDACFVPPVSIGHAFETVGVIDASSLKDDEFTYGACAFRDVTRFDPVTQQHRKTRALVFDFVDGFEAAKYWQEDADAMLDHIAARFKACGVRTVHGDQREALMMASGFARRGFKFVEHPYTTAAKTFAVERVSRLLQTRSLVLPEHQAMHDQMLDFEYAYTPGGKLTFEGRDHDDYVSLLLTLALADDGSALDDFGRKKNVIPGSVMHKPTIVDAMRLHSERSKGPPAPPVSLPDYRSTTNNKESA